MELTDEARKMLEDEFKLKREAVELLSVIAAEFDSDPLSVQCFDLRTVGRVKIVTKQLRDMGVR